MDASNDSEPLLLLDIRRSFLLRSYVECWGMPRSRTRSRHRERDERIEVYEFPGSPPGPLHRFATVGVSCHRVKDGGHINRELLLVLPADLGGATADRVTSFMLDLAAHAMHTIEVFDGRPVLLPESPRVPETWKPRALLLDEAVGEPEALSAMQIGDETVEVLWVIPIHASEHAFIDREGIDRFYELDERHEFSLVDIDRPPFA